MQLQTNDFIALMIPEAQTKHELSKETLLKYTLLKQQPVEHKACLILKSKCAQESKQRIKVISGGC